MKKMVIGTCISIFTLNVNGLNDPPKDTDWLNGYEHIHMYISCTYVVYKRPTSDLGTHTD